MTRFKLLLHLLLVLLLILGGCARKGINRAGDVTKTPRIIFQFSVAGTLPLNRSDITFYIVMNAPDGAKDQNIDVATQGPRINGPSLNDTNINLRGRLPFTGLLPGDVESVWTDFYFIQGSADGRGVVGRGVRLPDGTPEITVRNYAQAFWRSVSPNTFEIQMLYSDIFANAAEYPANIAVNLAASDNIDTGQGFVFDWWLSNIPFSITTAPNNTDITNRDPNNQLIMRPMPIGANKPQPQLPTGLNANDLNIVSYQYRIIVI